ncbi:MAG: hypothetical protein K6T66_13695, partial [Peptococcaceae bacterium]|nr:hypothetical protein [Peptococcaceae bacterium]
SAAKRIISGQLNVRQAESLVKKMAATRARERMRRGRVKEYRVLEKDLSNILEAEVKIKEMKDGCCRVVMEFKNKTEMISFLNALKEEKGLLIPGEVSRETNRKNIVATGG